MDICTYIDQTLLNPEATDAELREFVRTSAACGFASLCVDPVHIPILRQELGTGHASRICTVVGFPTGMHTTEVKVFEAREAVNAGAQEVDMVINLGWVKGRMFDLVAEEVAAVVRASGVCTKVIIETALLSDDEKCQLCAVLPQTGAQFVKTSTGWHAGASIEDVRLLASSLQGKMRIKASGGIRTREQATAMIEAGAHRIGTSKGLEIMASGPGVKD